MRIKEIGILGTIIFLTILFSYPYHQGISPFDSGDYLQCALNLLKGKWDTQNFYSHRIGTYAPIALALNFFGFTPLITWVTCAELIAFIIVLFCLLRKYNTYIALTSCAFCSILPVVLTNSGMLLGDILIMALTNLCLLWVWVSRDINTKERQILAGCVLAGLWICAFLTKESAFFYIIPISILCIKDLYRKKNYAFWASTAICLVCMGIAIIYFYYLKTGNPLLRLQALEHGPNLSNSNYFRSSSSQLLLRLTILPLKFLVENSSFVLIALLASIHLFSGGHSRDEKFFIFFLVSIIICWWLGTQSFVTWNPVALIDRIWLPVLVPLSINAAHTLYYIAKGEQKRYKNRATIIILIIVSVVSVIAAYINTGNVFWHQNPLVFIALRFCLVALLFIVIFSSKITHTLLAPIREHLGLVIIFVPLLYFNSAINFINGTARNSDYYDEIEMIDFLTSKKQSISLIVEPVIFNKHGVYNGFAPDSLFPIKYFDWNKLNLSAIEQLKDKRPLFLMVNDNRQWYIAKNFDEALFYAQIPNGETTPLLPIFLKESKNWKLAKKNKRVSLYRYYEI